MARKIFIRYRRHDSGASVGIATPKPVVSTFFLSVHKIPVHLAFVAHVNFSAIGAVKGIFHQLAGAFGETDGIIPDVVGKFFGADHPGDDGTGMDDEG